MMRFYKRKGFTLLELMIVVIIIGILASLAIPRFLVARNKAIRAEAFNMLGAIRGAQMRYYLENNNNYSGDINLLDVTVDPASAYYTYTAVNGAASVVGTATGIIGTAVEGDDIDIEDDGDIIEN